MSLPSDPSRPYGSKRPPPSLGPLDWLRWTLLDQYLLTSLLRPGLVCFTVTLTMMMLERAIRLINQIVIGGGEVGFFFPLMAAELPYYIGLALPASFFIAMFMVIIRMDEGSEIEAMLASGRSLARIAGPMIGLGGAFAVISLLVLGYLEPYGHYQFRRIQNVAVQAGWSGKLQSGGVVTADKSSTLTADSADTTGKRVDGVFISRLAPDGTETLITAASAVLRNEPDQQTVSLAVARGRDVAEGSDGKVQVSNFENVTLSAGRGAVSTLTARGQDPREMTLTELMRGRSPARNAFPPGALQAELLSRLGRALSLPLLPLLTLPLGIASKRGRRTPSLVTAGLVLVCFHHGVEVVRSMAAIGQADPFLAVGGLFFGFMAFALWLFLGSLKRPGETPLSGVLEWVGQAFEYIGGVFSRIWGSMRPSRPWRLPSWTRGPSSRTATLQGYVVRQLVIRTAAAAAVIVTLLQLFEMLGRATEILSRGVGLGGLAYYMLLAAPSMVQQSVGFAMFAGVVLTFTELARKGEMIAMRAAGVSLRQLVGMLIPVALMVGAIALIVGDQIAPVAERTMQAWLQATALPGPGAETGPRWFRVGDDIVRADSASRQGDIIKGVRIYRRDASHMMRERIVAASATAGAEGWVLHNAKTLTIESDHAEQTASGDRAWPTKLKPDDVTDIFRPTLQISALDAYRGLNGAANDRSAGYLLTRIYRLLAEPLAPLVMLLLASPLAMVNGRNVRGVGPVLYGVGGGMAYLVADGLLTASGQTGVLPATAAAWTAPLIFAIAAFTVLLYVEL